jgi:DNA-binding response OmpR family regulator
MPAKILVVDDERNITEFLRAALAREGYEVRLGFSAEDFLRQVRAWRPDLVLLDIMMPGEMSGLDALRLLRRDSDVPVILVTAKAEEAEKVLGLEYADDYVTKPFGVPEMLARLRAVLRRARPRTDERAEEPILAGDLRIDPQTREVLFAGQTLGLTLTEYGLLSTLAAHPGRVFPREELIARVWGQDVYVDPRTLDVHIRSLRRKLEPDPAAPQYLLTVRGVGYRWAA